MVQLILSSLDSDEVNHYAETTESLQVANIIETVYNDLVSNIDMPDHYDLFQLDPHPDFPTRMVLPSNVISVDWIKYRGVLLRLQSLEYFLEYYISPARDKDPTQYTTPDDKTFWFDSFDEAVEANLQKENTLCWGKLVPSFQFADDFIPNLDPEQFSLLFNEAKALAFAELKQTPHQKAERKARDAKIRTQHTKDILYNDHFYKRPNYGRKN